MVQRQSRRRAALSTLVGTGATVAITVAQAFILIPLCLANLGTALYGAWLAASELLIWLQFLDLGIPNLMTQRIGASVGRNDDIEAAQWAGTGLWALITVGAALTVLALIAAPFIAMWVRVSAADADAFTASFRIGALASAILLTYNGVLGIARGAQLTGLMNAAQVAGALTGLVVAIALLLAGFGVWALAFGLLARAVISLLGAALFVIGARRASGVRLGRPSAAVLRQMLGLAPSMGAANAAYLLANNSELLLVNTLFGPVPAAVYALTRRAMEGFRQLLDSIAWAVYGSFAHLVTAEDRHRARTVLDEVLWLRLAAACLCGAVVLAVNQPFVTLLFGAEHFGGVWLTAGFAVQMIVGGQTFLANYLLRATGLVREGSILLMSEAAARVAAIAAGLLMAGLAGAPWAAVAVSACALFVMRRALHRALPPALSATSPPPMGSRLAPFALLAFGLAVAVVRIPVSWASVGGVAAALTIVGAVVLWWMLPPFVSDGSLMRWNRA